MTTFRLDPEDITPENENYDGICHVSMNIRWEDGESQDFEMNPYQFAVVVRVLGLLSDGRNEKGLRRFSCHTEEVYEKIMNGVYDPIRDIDHSAGLNPREPICVDVDDDYNVHVKHLGDLP